MPEHYSRRILQHMADQRYRPQTIRDLAQQLQVADDDLPSFERTVNELIDEGHAIRSASDTIALPPPGREMSGTFRLASRGFGFIVPDEPTQHGDLFVPPPNTGGAMTGDHVRARVIRERGRAGGGRSPYVGKIVEILKRADKHYVGNLTRQGRLWTVEVDGKLIPQPVIIRDPHARDAREGDKVVIELISFPDDETESPEGVITEVLGERGLPEVETLAVMRAFGLPDKFEAQVIEDARASAATYKPDTIPPGRVDLTDVLIATIDPPDARDFDDAISIDKFDQPQTDGAVWELGVHIADVSHFVPVGTALDQEAAKRGNSTYLPRKVVPMLPELLSNGVCSLQEGVNRYAKSAFMRYDADGKVVGSRFANSVIRSAKRLTYLEAQALIDGDIKEARKHARSEPKYSQQLIQRLQLMNELAHTIRQRRLRDGMIVLALPEVELVFDDSGRVIDAVPEDDAFTHRLIEMFMVEANEAVARLFDNLRLPMIRRVHPDPPAHDIGELRQFARVAGYNIPAHPSRKELQHLLDSVRGKPQQHAIHLAVLQTLSKAEYAPLIIGHFALASEHYTHFTSPIRRYPDLVVHRALDAYFELYADHLKRDVPGGKRAARLGRDLAGDPRVPDEKALEEIGKHCSTTERNSEAAERALRNYLVLELLSQHLGDDFEGTVTGVTGSGIFVQIDRYLVDGFIHIAELPGGRRTGDQWRLNRTTGALVAQRSGKTINIGDRFVVRVAKVDLISRKLDLVIVEQADEKKKTKRVQPVGARNAQQQTQKIKTQKAKPQKVKTQKAKSSKPTRRKKKS